MLLNRVTHLISHYTSEIISFQLQKREENLIINWDGKLALPNFDLELKNSTVAILILGKVIQFTITPIVDFCLQQPHPVVTPPRTGNGP